MRRLRKYRALSPAARVIVLRSLLLLPAAGLLLNDGPDVLERYAALPSLAGR